EVLANLVRQEIPWDRVTGFHLDEYVGLRSDHPASFCRYLQERFVDQVPLSDFHFLRGDQPTDEVIADVSGRLAQHPIDVALVGIGENGHLAFNDPPADFETKEAYLRVQLDEACRQQQVGEGWFDRLEDVPTEAISMSVQQILKSKTIFCSVPDQRKSQAVMQTVEGPVTPDVPASILQQHGDVTLALDDAAASQLSTPGETVGTA
ncbi:MAG: 6-phosphogluconolactonase, partial [Planctomycetota bacterium]